MGLGPDRRRSPRYGLYRTAEEPLSATTIARVLAELPREFDHAAIKRALDQPADKPIIVRSAQLDLRRLRLYLESVGVMTEEAEVPDRRKLARTGSLAEKLKMIFKRA